MKAAVFRGIGDLVISDVPTPEASQGQVLVSIAACGICGTDRHIMHGEFTTHPPVIIGHECSGTIVAVGTGIADLKPGDHVALDPNMFCGVCRPCQRGQVHLCENLHALGVDEDGGFAEYCVMPRSQCYRLDEQISLLAGAMTEPLACCLRGIDRAEIQAGDIVAVIGGGAIGQMLAQLARLRGAAKVILSDPIAARRDMALQLGADAVIDPVHEDPLSGGETLAGGADIVIEAVGSQRTTTQAIAWAARGATILWFGVTPPGETVALEPNLIFQKELTIKGSFINPFTHRRAVALLASGRIVVEPLITRQIGLEALPGVLAEPVGNDIKTVVVPGI